MRNSVTTVEKSARLTLSFVTYFVIISLRSIDNSEKPCLLSEEGKMRVQELETPAAIVNLDLLDSNIHRFQEYLNEHEINNRPHIKTHKIPEIAHKQVQAGAVGITCQKLGEAEIMVQSGIRDVFLPYNILGEAKLERLRRLSRRAAISVTADSAAVVEGLSAMARHEDQELEVLVEFDTGLGRCGVQSPAEATDLALLIHRKEGLAFGGLMTYPNNENTDPFVRGVRQMLEPHGVPTRRVSGGGTQVMWQVHEHETITEHRAGMYIYGDRYTVSTGAIKLEECSFKIVATVVSRPTPDRGILDAGSKTLSSDLLNQEGHGLILEYPDAVIYSLSEEHGHVDFSRCSDRPDIGERVSVLPNHCCVANNLFNEVVGIRSGRVEVIWPVLARGAIR
jgi:D-serine deaminase-like pyridoxal phosphate-dependent protein